MPDETHSGPNDKDVNITSRAHIGVLKNADQDIGHVRLLLGSLDLEVLELEAGIVQLAQLDDVLKVCDGFLILGRDPHVHPALYGQEPLLGIDRFDPVRDQFSIPCVTRLLASGIPLLAVCGGMQEMQVALGGRLVQDISLVAKHNKHAFGYENEDRRAETVHGIDIVPGGLFERLFGQVTSFDVNSIHEQGMTEADLAPGLRVEAKCDDVIEAISYNPHPFALGVQFHPELDATYIHYRTIFAAFKNAVDIYAHQRRPSGILAVAFAAPAEAL